MGPTHACQTAPSEHVGSPGLPYRLLLGTSSHQISSAYFFFGGGLSLAAVLHSIASGGYSGFRPFLSSEPFPRTARQQRITILAKYALFIVLNICKCEFVNRVLAIRSYCHAATTRALERCRVLTSDCDLHRMRPDVGKGPRFKYLKGLKEKKKLDKCRSIVTNREKERLCQTVQYDPQIQLLRTNMSK